MQSSTFPVPSSRITGDASWTLCFRGFHAQRPLIRPISAIEKPNGIGNTVRRLRIFSPNISGICNREFYSNIPAPVLFSGFRDEQQFTSTYDFIIDVLPRYL